MIRGNVNLLRKWALLREGVRSLTRSRSFVSLSPFQPLLSTTGRTVVANKPLFALPQLRIPKRWYEMLHFADLQTDVEHG